MTGAPYRVSVVIPVLNAAAHLPSLFRALSSQQPAGPEEIVLVDSMSADHTREVAAADPRARVVPIENFSHGRARNLGAREARGEIVVLMTQDALPRDERWLANLLEPFGDPTVAATFSRQEPKPDANPMERFFLSHRFPDAGPVRRETRGRTHLRLEDVFFSNVSAAVRREVLLKHPFDEDLIMSEDQQFARDILQAGHATVYRPDSVVIHSHNYTLGHAFRRYFDSVYSLRKIFRTHGFGTSASMGARYVAEEIGYIVRRYPLWLPYYFLYNIAKTSGTIAAHLADRLPRSVVRRLSLHRYYWEDG